MWEFDIEEYKEALAEIYREKIDITKNSYKKICHYTSPFGLDGILKSKTIRFTEFSVLNDASEGKMIYDCLGYCLKKQKNNISKEFYEAVFDAVIFDNIDSKWNQYIKIKSYNYFVACFCKNKDSLSMWNYYTKTKDSLGYSVVFDFETIFTNLVSSGSELFDVTCFKVNYNYKSHLNIIRNLLLKANEYWENTKCVNDKGQLINEFKNIIEFLKLSFKNHAFISEEEVRFVIRIENELFRKNIKYNNGDEMIKLQYSNGIYKPFIDLEFGGSKAIKQIMVSPTIRDSASISSVKFLMDKYEIEADVFISNIPLMY